jgi:photosystem II stability/assembly factor-like uncharacterized protein
MKMRIAGLAAVGLLVCLVAGVYLVSSQLQDPTPGFTNAKPTAAEPFTAEPTTPGPATAEQITAESTLAEPSTAEHQKAGKQRKVSGARQALQWWSSQRIYPHDTMPSAGYYAAYKHTRANLTEQAGKSRNAWSGLGPHNIGGRTLAVAFNPQNPSTVYAGAASGGLWRSYTAGRGADAWEQVVTGFPVLGVSCIAIESGDSNTMYIGTGEVYAYDNTEGGIAVRHTRGSFGMGILKTTDGGDTWAHSLDWTYEQGRGIWAVRIDPTNPDVVWAGTTEGVYKSLDAGQTWDQVYDVVMVTDLVIHTTNPDIVLIACGNFGSPGHGLYRTLNGGDSWNQITQPGVIPTTYMGKAQLSICESVPDVVMASIGNGDPGSDATWLLRSEDAGATWVTASTADYSRWQGWFSHDVAINPEDPSEVIAAGIDIWKSTSGGFGLSIRSDWSAWYFGQVLPGDPEGPPWYSHADHHDIAYHPTDRDIIYFANDGGIFRSLDGGETFEGCNGGFQTQQFYAGFSTSQRDSNHAMGGMQDNSTAIYDGTLAWIRVIGGDGSWTGIDALNDDILYGSAQYLRMFKSTDRGVSWFEVSPPELGNTSFIAPFALGGLSSPESPNIVFAGRSWIFKSTNGAGNWSALVNLGSNPALALAVSPLNSDVVYVTTAPVYSRAEVFRTVNGGADWVNITGSLPDRYPVGLAIDPNADGTVYVTFSGFGTGHVFKSTDAGGLWNDITGNLPDLPTSSVIVDPLRSSHLYVGNDLGVYFSPDGGASWELYSSGLPEAVVAMDLTISPTNRKLRVSTYGNGVYERDLVYVPVDVPDGDSVVSAFRLEQNHPNPFNPSTTIRYHLARDGEVVLTIFDAAGARVRTLVQQHQGQGDHTVRWDGRDASGRTVPSGTYLYELKAGDQRETRKMTLLK